MITTWRQTLDDSSAPPEEMSKDVEGFVRRKTWERTGEEGQHFELNVYLGVDMFGAVVICWTAWLREHGVRRDYMASATNVYSGLPISGGELERVADGIRPVEVCRYTMWGALLFHASSR